MRPYLVKAQPDQPIEVYPQRLPICAEAIMKNNIGIESIVLVLDASNALLAHFGCSAGAGVWFVTVSVVAAIILF